ncbi:MAG: type II secretion system F family protein [Phycisphaerae bacterium]|nr:type II secretion system F family protein [Phycisphaerae bacterium]
MPVFTYEAMNSVGQPVKDEIEAGSSEEAISKVRAMGHFPTKIKAKAIRRGAKAAAAPGARAEEPAKRRKRVGKVSSKHLTQFTRQMSTLNNAGLPILRSLRILEEQQKPGPLRVALRLVGDDVEGGTTLSEAMARQPKAFDSLYTNMIQAGELGGVLDVVLQKLAEFRERSQALQKKVISAMIYPAAVITFSVLIVTGIMMFVVPKFQDIFGKMGKDLPGITLALLNASKFVVNGGWLVILVSPLGIWAVLKVMRMSPGGRMLLDRVKLSVPIFGKITLKTAVARFARTLGTLLSAGVPILEALDITRKTTGNEVMARALARVHDGIREGENFAEPLKLAKVVEPMVVNMIDVGEETGELDNMLERVADTYDGDVESMVAGMVSLLEPVMVVTLGTIVGFIVIALFMPMVSLLQSVGQ